ncbi:MAG TPA: hypothetical protein VIK74_01180, partial [Parasegetibacter sp.]
MKQKSKKEYQDKDGLLKIVLRKCMKNTLRAAVPNAEDIFDLSQEIEPMDQELPLIWQGRKKQGKRIVDFVFKIPLKN